jgi:hypothetical protein
MFITAAIECLVQASCPQLRVKKTTKCKNSTICSSSGCYMMHDRLYLLEGRLGKVVIDRKIYKRHFVHIYKRQKNVRSIQSYTIDFPFSPQNIPNFKTMSAAVFSQLFPNPQNATEEQKAKARAFGDSIKEAAKNRQSTETIRKKLEELNAKADEIDFADLDKDGKLDLMERVQGM